MQREELFSALGTLMIRFKVYAKRALQQVRQAVPLALDLKTACRAPGRGSYLDLHESRLLQRRPLPQAAHSAALGQARQARAAVSVGPRTPPGLESGFPC